MKLSRMSILHAPEIRCTICSSINPLKLIDMLAVFFLFFFKIQVKRIMIFRLTYPLKKLPAQISLLMLITDE